MNKEEMEAARLVTIDGRRRALRRTTLWAGGAAALWLFLMCDAQSSRYYLPTEYFSSPQSKYLAVVLMLILFTSFFRWRSLRSVVLAQRELPAPAEQEESREPKAPSGTVIVCSGGGMKSASFCMGALQALNEAKIYSQCKALVGVSGGGYIAAAFAIAHSRAQQGGAGNTSDTKSVFAQAGPEVAALRRRTNYLANSWQVRYNFLLSMLFGMAVNLILLASIAISLALLLAAQISLTDLVSVSGDSWTFNPHDRGFGRLFLASEILVALSVILFLGHRLRRRPARKHGRTLQGGMTMREWFSSAPHVLAAIALVFAALYPGVPWLACAIHNFSVAEKIDWWNGWQQALVTVTAIFGLFAVVRSAWKGGAKENSTTTIGTILQLVRTYVAPWLNAA